MIKNLANKYLGSRSLSYATKIYTVSIAISLWLFGVLIKVLSPVLIPVIKTMANTGIGTDTCLKHGFLPVKVHYYQPIPNLAELEKRDIWNKVSEMKGIKFEPKKNIEFVKKIAEKYAEECNWPEEPTSDPMQFYLRNNNFSYGCAAPLHCMIREYKPKQIIEVGSGNSSKVIAAALHLNLLENCNAKYTIIDPYSRVDQLKFPENTTILRQPVETINLAIFETLGENDILFIDSSHVCKIGSDVNFEILEILPLLKKGVIIHFHDIELPYEYPKTYSTNPKFRVFWTESYLLQAFLIMNIDFQTIIPMAYLQKAYLEDLKMAFPHSSKTNWGWVSGSFWIKRVSMTSIECS